LTGESSELVGFYNAGIAALGLALSLTAAPPLSGSEQFWRWSAFALALILTALEIGWIVRDEITHQQLLRVARQSDG
jgi:hypothetical protein